MCQKAKRAFQIVNISREVNSYRVAGVPEETERECKGWGFHGGDYEEFRLLRKHVTPLLQTPAG
jgi:hypothetical protein